MGWLDENDRPITGFKSTEQGASTRVWAAVGTELEGFGGRYLEDCAEALPWSPERPRFGVRPYAVDPVSAERLWARSEGLVRVDLDGDDVVFMTSADTIKGKSILRDGRVALCWDDERPPFAFVTLTGRATTSTDPVELLRWGMRIGGRYMGAEQAEAYGRRNAVPPEMVVRVRVEHVVAKVDIAD